MEYLKDRDNKFPICSTCSHSIKILNKVPKWSYVFEKNNYGFPLACLGPDLLSHTLAELICVSPVRLYCTLIKNVVNNAKTE